MNPRPLAIICCLLAVSTSAAQATQFESALTDGDRILLVDGRTGNVQAVHFDGLSHCTGASLSPDGQRLAFTSVDDDSFARLYVGSVTGGVPTRVGAAEGSHRDPSWSPDGKRLYFALRRQSRHFERPGMRDPARLLEYSLETGAIRVLDDGDRCRIFPSLSPDGKTLIHTETDCATTWNIAELDLTTGRVRAKTFGRRRDHQPVISPDGKQFAFGRSVGSRTEIHVGNREGGSTRVVARTDRAESPPLRWAKDGRQLMWVIEHVVWRLDLSQKDETPTPLMTRPVLMAGGER